MTLKLRATHLAPPAYAHLKQYVVVSTLLSGSKAVKQFRSSGRSAEISGSRTYSSWAYSLQPGNRLRRAWRWLRTTG